MREIVRDMIEAGIYPHSRAIARKLGRNTLNDVEGLTLRLVLTDLLKKGLGLENG